MAKQKEMNDAVKRALAEPDVSHAAREYAELGLNAILDEGVLHEVPVVGTLLALRRVGSSVKDAILVRKLLQFLGELESLTAEERLSFVDRIETEPIFGHRVGERLVELLDRIDSYAKPAMVARIFCAYAKGKVESNEMLRLINAVELLPIFEMEQIPRFHSMTKDQRKSLSPLTGTALVNAGLAYPRPGLGGIMSYEPSPLCKVFLSIGLLDVMSNKSVQPTARSARGG